MDRARRINELVATYDDGSSHVVVIDVSTLTVVGLSGDAPSMIGSTHDALLGCNALDMIHPDDQLRAAEAISQVVGYDGPRPPGMYRIRQGEGFRAAAVSAMPIVETGLDVIVYLINDLDERHRAEALAAEQVEIMEMRTLRAPLDACLDALVRMGERHADGLHLAITVLGGESPRRTGFVVAGAGIGAAFLERRRQVAADALPASIVAAVERNMPTVCLATRDPEPFADPRHQDYRRCVTSPLVGASGELLGFIEGFDESTAPPGHAEWNLHSLMARLASLFLDQVRFEQQLEAAANSDPLTGLANRRKLNAELERLSSSGRPYALAMVDLDQFAWVNNNFGHSEGDRLLVEVARRLEAALEVRSIVARPAGDEFVVCIPNVVDHDEAVHLGTQLIESLQQPFDAIRDEPGVRHHGIRASIGLALAEAGESFERVMSLADAAMYDAKRSGGDALRCPDSRLGGQARHRHDLRRRLTSAIENDQLHLVLQPLVSLDTGRFHSAEVLVRWEEHGQIVATPDEFVALAEESDLILALDEWVLRHAGILLGDLIERNVFVGGGRLWVNLSPRTMQQPGLPAMVESLVGRDAAPQFGVEITERAVDTDPTVLAARIADLRAAGFSIALDDFGTGFGTLLQLAELPATDVKIDGSFVAKMLEQPVYATLVEATIALAQRLDMSVTAEAIESRDQWQRLRALGCDLGQGFHFAAPMAPDHFVTWLSLPSPSPATSVRAGGVRRDEGRT